MTCPLLGEMAAGVSPTTRGSRGSSRPFSLHREVRQTAKFKGTVAGALFDEANRREGNPQKLRRLPLVLRAAGKNTVLSAWIHTPSPPHPMSPAAQDWANIAYSSTPVGAYLPKGSGLRHELTKV